MHLATNFNKLARIDTTRKEYADFKSAILNIDWKSSPAVRPSNPALAYAPGVMFSDIPFVNNHPAHFRLWGIANMNNVFQTLQFKKLWKTSIPMFTYIEELVPDHRVVKAEIMATPPEIPNKQNEYKRIHIDPRKMHTLAKRCQIALVSNPESYLFVEGNQIQITEGTIYEFDNRRCHWGVNWGNTMKIILVIDIIDLNVWNNLSKQDKDTFFDVNVTQQELDYMNNYKSMWLNSIA